MSSTADIERHLPTLIDTVDSRLMLLAVETLLTQPAPKSPALEQTLEEALPQPTPASSPRHAGGVAAPGRSRLNQTNRLVLGETKR